MQPKAGNWELSPYNLRSKQANMPVDGLLITGSVQLDCLIAAAVGAAGNRMNHWYHAGRPSGRMAIYALGYVFSGGAVGFFFGVYFANFLVALIFGGVWPVAVEAREAAQTVIKVIVESLRTATSAADAIASQKKADTDKDNEGSNDTEQEGRKDQL